jgi:hypothetical protein
MPPEQLDASLFSRDKREFIALLHKHQVRYLVVGGEAVIFYGYARLTGDVDFYFSADEENAKRLWAALSEFWQGHVPGLSQHQELMEAGVIVQFGRPPNRIDLLNGISGVEFDEAWPRRREVLLVSDAATIPLCYIGLDDLIRNKVAANRPKDLDDVQYLHRAKGTS